jgi:hypothetical protein
MSMALCQILLLLVACFNTVQAHFNAADDDWDWSRTRTWALVGQNDYLTNEQANFLATHYDIIGLGGAFGYGDPSSKPGLPVNEYELGEAAAAKQLKDINPDVKIIVYRNSQLYIGEAFACGKTFEAHPEWTLKNATGGPVRSYMDLTQKACANWFINCTMSAFTDYVNGSNIDGLYLDGSNEDGRQTGHTLAPGMASKLNASHSAVLKEITARVHAIRSEGLTIGNGGIMDVCYRAASGSAGNGSTVREMGCASNLDALDGVCGEHFGAFGSVNTTTGDYDGANMEHGWNSAIETVQRYGNPRETKKILVKAWPGPLGMYFKKNATTGRYLPGPVIEITWKKYSNGTHEPWDASMNPMTPLQKRENAAIALDWALAAYLLTAAPGTYFSYAWWYQMDTGYIPCSYLVKDGKPDNNCGCPDDWYPALLRPTGKPLAPRRLEGGGSGFVYTREFEQVSVRVDLGNFSDVTLAWK